MTIADLRQILTQNNKQENESLTRLTAAMRGKQFFCGNLEGKGLCCFNHIIGLPEKQGIPKPIFDYEEMILDKLLIADGSIQDKHLFIKKATGLGITELTLRFMVWLCCCDDTYRNTQMVIVTGPSIEIAIKLVKRIKALFERHEIYFEFKETYLELNGVQIEAFPSHHLDTFRALESPSLILLDEADFFPQSQQVDARHVSERYIAKSDPFIIMVSTPNAPGGLFNSIENEPEHECIYKRLKMDYTLGLNKIYTSVEIEKAKATPGFEREFNLRYLGFVGNSFRQSDIQRAIQFEYNPDDFREAYEGSMGIDPAFGSSNFAITITALVDDKVRVVFSEEYNGPDHMSMVSLCADLIKKYNCIHAYVDGANPGFISSLKSSIGEDPQYIEAIARLQKSHAKPELNMRVLPVNFSTEHKKLLANMKMILSDRLLAIDKRFDKLITSLNTASDIENALQKQSMSNSDSLDSLRLALSLYEYT